jgi:hypothetical protein
MVLSEVLEKSAQPLNGARRVPALHLAGIETFASVWIAQLNFELMTHRDTQLEAAGFQLTKNFAVDSAASSVEPLSISKLLRHNLLCSSGLFCNFPLDNLATQETFACERFGGS